MPQPAMSPRHPATRHSMRSSLPCDSALLTWCITFEGKWPTDGMPGTRLTVGLALQPTVLARMIWLCGAVRVRAACGARWLPCIMLRRVNTNDLQVCSKARVTSTLETTD